MVASALKDDGLLTQACIGRYNQDLEMGVGSADELPMERLHGAGDLCSMLMASSAL